MGHLFGMKKINIKLLIIEPIYRVLVPHFFDFLRMKVSSIARLVFDFEC